MPVAPSAHIHPTAVISPEASVGPGVRVGPFCVIDGAVTVGAECELSPHVHLVGPLVMGQGNKVGTGTVIGSDPQHLAYKGQATRTEVGDFNTFREHVTIHRGSHVEGLTRVGSHNYFMAHSHVGHDGKVGSHCILANGALMGGHCELQDRVFLSGNTALHQFVRMGRLTLVIGVEGLSRDAVPFLTIKNRYTVAGVNVVGMKRAGYSASDVMTVRKAYHVLYRSDCLLREATERLATEFAGHPLVGEMVAFIRSSKRGVMRSARERGGEED